MNQSNNLKNITPLNLFQTQLKILLQQHSSQLKSKSQYSQRATNKHIQYTHDQFYRQIEQLKPEDFIIKLGWKIATLTAQQIDLTLFCFALLQSNIKFPLKAYLKHNNKQKQDTIDGQDELWIQVFVKDCQNSINQCQKGLQNQVINFCNDFMVPILKRFIKQQVSWTKMRSKSFQDSIVVNKFNKQVISQINSHIVQQQFIK